MAKKATGNRSKVPQPADQKKMMRGTGDEIHQIAGGEVPRLTMQQGTPVADDQNSLRIGARGPTALEDSHFREKIFHFDHERIPERRAWVSSEILRRLIFLWR